jgi:DNA-binding transcriptional LysR family regulator
VEIRHLRYFLAVADLRNFTRAAEASFVAQSALSQQISRLEHEVGAPLFVRGGRSTELTPAGQVLLPHARRLVGGEAKARAEMRSYIGLETGRLHIGLIQTTASAVDMLAPLARFHELHPSVEVHIATPTSNEMVEAVRAGQLDLAVVGLHPSEIPDDLEHHALAVDPLVGVLATSAAVGLTAPVSVAELVARGQLISFTPGTGIRRHVDEALARAGIESVSTFEMTQVSDMVRFAAVGLGVTIVPRTVATSTDCAVNGLAFTVVGLSDPKAMHPVSVIYDNARISASGKEFLSLLAEGRQKKNRSKQATLTVGPIADG